MEERPREAEGGTGRVRLFSSREFDNNLDDSRAQPTEVKASFSRFFLWHFSLSPKKLFCANVLMAALLFVGSRTRQTSRKVALSPFLCVCLSLSSSLSSREIWERLCRSGEEE